MPELWPNTAAALRRILTGFPFHPARLEQGRNLQSHLKLPMTSGLARGDAHWQATKLLTLGPARFVSFNAAKNMNRAVFNSWPEERLPLVGAPQSARYPVSRGGLRPHRSAAATQVLLITS